MYVTTSRHQGSLLRFSLDTSECRIAASHVCSEFLLNYLLVERRSHRFRAQVLAPQRQLPEWSSRRRWPDDIGGWTVSSCTTSVGILALNTETSSGCTAAAAAIKQTEETEIFEVDFYEPILCGL